MKKEGRPVAGGVTITRKTLKVIGLCIVILGIPHLIRQSIYAQSGSPMDDLNSLRVEPEDWCTRYDRKAYPYPRSVEAAIIHAQEGMYSPYDLTCFSSPRQSDIEHIVAIAEAHSSGMCSRSQHEKEQFASDLLNLTLATPKLNREQKIAKDAAEWMPPQNQCWYAARVVAVKRKYRLSVDKAEKRALSNVLKRCRGVVIEMPACSGN